MGDLSDSEVAPMARDATGVTALPLRTNRRLQKFWSKVQGTTQGDLTAPSSQSSRNHRRSRLLGIAVALLVIAVGLLLIPVARFHLNHVVTDDAYVSGNIVGIAPSLTGRIAEISVITDQPIAPGDLIARLNDATERSQIARWEAEVERAKSREKETRIGLEIVQTRSGPLLEQDQAELDGAAARQEGAQVARDQAESDLQRTLRLADSEYVPPVHLELARTRLRKLTADLGAAKEELHKAKAGRKLSSSHEYAVLMQQQRVQTAKAERHLAEAGLASARLDLDRTNVRSPVRGIVAKMAAKPGETVEDGEIICLVRDLDDIWIVANVKETQLRMVDVGRAAVIRFEAYPDREYTGSVLSIGSVTRSQFSLIPRENLSEHFVKVVQRIPVRISIDDPYGQLPIGLSARVGIRKD